MNSISSITSPTLIGHKKTFTHIGPDKKSAACREPFVSDSETTEVSESSSGREIRHSGELSCSRNIPSADNGTLSSIRESVSVLTAAPNQKLQKVKVGDTGRSKWRSIQTEPEPQVTVQSKSSEDPLSFEQCVEKQGNLFLETTVIIDKEAKELQNEKTISDENSLDVTDDYTSWLQDTTVISHLLRDKAELDETVLDRTHVDKTQLDRTILDRSQLDKTQVDETQADDRSETVTTISFTDTTTLDTTSNANDISEEDTDTDSNTSVDLSNDSSNLAVNHSPDVEEDILESNFGLELHFNPETDIVTDYLSGDALIPQCSSNTSEF